MSDTHDGRRQRRRMTVMVYPTAEAKVINGISNKGVSNQPYPQITLKEARKSIQHFNQREARRRQMKRSGVPLKERPSKMKFCKEHDTNDVLGSVKKLYINERDNWIWADIVASEETNSRVEDDIIKKGIDGISMGYFLENDECDHKEIKEISLVEDPDFLNSRVKVIHSANQQQQPPVNFFVIARARMSQANNNNNQVSDDASTSDESSQVVDDMEYIKEFDNLTPEEKVEFLKSSHALHLEQDKKDEQQKRQSETAELEARADEFVGGINTLVNSLETNTEQRDLLGNTLLTEALNNETFGTTVKLFDATISKERERAAELERKNKQLAEQLSSMQSNAKNQSRQQARNSSVFKQSVNHSASGSNMSRNLFTYIRNKNNNKRGVSDISPDTESDSSSSTSSFPVSAPASSSEPPTKITHSAHKEDVHADYLAVDPRTGCSFAPLFSQAHRQKVQYGAGAKQLVVHSATGSTRGHELVSDPNTSSFLTELSLLESVYRGTRDFGDGFSRDDIPNSLFGTNPKQAMLIMSEKRISGNHVSNKSENVRGTSQRSSDGTYLRPDDPSINPHDRRDPGYLSRLCVTREEFGTERTRR